MGIPEGMTYIICSSIYRKLLFYIKKIEYLRLESTAGDQVRAGGGASGLHRAAARAGEGTAGRLARPLREGGSGAQRRGADRRV